MDTVANTPAPGLAPELPARPADAVSAAAAMAAAVVPDIPRSTVRKAMDVLVTIYAYGLLTFGLFFPFALAAWSLIFWPPVQ